MSAGGSDAGYPSGSRPAGDGLRIYPEQGSHLSRREQALVVAVHVQSPPTVSPEPPVRYASSLAPNEYFLPRFLEIRGLRLADSREKMSPAGTYVCDLLPLCLYGPLRAAH